ncbi:IS1634 family transposase [uncultured Allobaculum sp.]|uniref:IS1634 family transposase n=1 Tax=uncultured Allobaculum sp. TaxID=1187017 RepID=UPI0025A68D9F|nr:IS1634 family transposase [uncultured Allobaculum sp.]
MRIRTTKTKNGRLFYVIKTYYDSHGKEHSVTVEKLGNEHDIRNTYGQDPDLWAKQHVAELNAQEQQENQDLQLTFSRTKQLTKNYQYTFQIGYLFLQCIYHRLGLHQICRTMTKRHSFQYDLNAILSRLIYGRVLEPCSKRATHAFSKTLLEKPEFEEHQIYRALDVLAEESDFIQSSLYQNSFALGKRRTGVLYYDCTNFYFEIEQSDENGSRQYGKSKENRPLPIVEMGLFTDMDGIPLGVCVHPGNTNEQKTLKPMEEKILSDYGLSKFIVCTDAGLASKANRKFNNVKDRSYIVTQSIKKLKKQDKEWALSRTGWFRYGDKQQKQYNLDQIDETRHKDSVFYRECLLDCGSFEERLIVTYSLKYRNYQRTIRNRQIERAQRDIQKGRGKAKKNQNDYRRFISKTAVTDDGEVASKDLFAINEERIAEEEAHDGFYAVCTTLEDDIGEIIRVNHQRWKIEECFRIMKTDFSARPAYVQTDAHIEAHFLVCFLALTVYRYLEVLTGKRFTCDQLLQTLRDMKVREVLGEGYLPTYTRTDVTDALHDAFGLRTDYHVLTKADMKKIVKQTKRKV